MAHFDPGPLPKDEIKPAWMRRFVDLLMLCLNNINETNFKTTISGTIITPDTLNVKMSDLEWKEIPVPLVLPAQGVGTTSTTGIPLGGYFYWNPSAYSGGDWYLECSLVTTAGTVTCTLTGATDIGSVSSTSTSLTIVRSKLTMPSTAQNIWVKLSVNNSANTGTLTGARLIFVPS
jgi:hypothetical protein